MSPTTQSENPQRAAWNGPGGDAWVESQELMDTMFRPLEELLVAAIVCRDDIRQVLDVGCGTGAVSLASARLLQGKGESTGIDISEPMLALARFRAESAGLPLTFVCDDAQAHAFKPATFDAILSRFGVMFFGDPLAAFANLHRAAKPGAALRFLSWRSPDENPFMLIAERAAAPFLPDLPPRRTDAPGQFYFADPDFVRSILELSGWKEVSLTALDAPITFPESALEYYFTRLGPVGQALTQAGEATRSQVIEAVRPVFDPYIHGGEIRFTAALWQVDAKA